MEKQEQNDHKKRLSFKKGRNKTISSHLPIAVLKSNWVYIVRFPWLQCVSAPRGWCLSLHSCFQLLRWPLFYIWNNTCLQLHSSEKCFLPTYTILGHRNFFQTISVRFSLIVPSMYWVSEKSARRHNFKLRLKEWWEFRRAKKKSRERKW